MRLVSLLLPLSACFELPSSERPLCEGEGCADSADSADSALGGEGEGETGDDEGADLEAPSSCADVEFEAEALTWERGDAASTWGSSELTCTPVDFEDWELELEWSVPSVSGFVMNPVVAPVDGADWSTVFVEHGGGVDLYDGRDGTLIRSIEFGLGEEDGSTPAVGDANGDGDLEFVTTTWQQLRIQSLGSGEITLASYLDPMVNEDELSAWVDADGDGNLDIALMDSVWTMDGDNISSFDGGLEPTGLFAADLDQDGQSELFTANGVVSALDGTGPGWGSPADAVSGYAIYGGPVSVDGDSRVWFNLGRHDTYLGGVDGSIDEVHDLGGERWLASIGDVDGDSAPEMCVFDGFLGDVVMLTLEGEALWSWSVGEGYVAGGCTMADLDGDGLYEVLLSTWFGMAILDGATGAPLEEVDDTSTVARDSAPVVADIDGDGSAEIIWSDGFSLRVYGAASGRFARTRPVWNQLAYDITSIQDNGELVSWPRPSWEAYNAFRAQPAHDGEHPDLGVEVLDTCVEDCDGGTVGVRVRVGNRGSMPASAGAVLHLYSVDEGGPEDLATLTLDEALLSGESVEAWIWAEISDLGPRIAVDVSSADADECDQVNNRQMVRLSCD